MIVNIASILIRTQTKQRQQYNKYGSTSLESLNSMGQWPQKKLGGGGEMTHTTRITGVGGGDRKIYGYEDSQAVPTRSSDKGRHWK